MKKYKYGKYLVYEQFFGRLNGGSDKYREWFNDGRKAVKFLNKQTNYLIKKAKETNQNQFGTWILQRIDW